MSLQQAGKDLKKLVIAGIDATKLGIGQPEDVAHAVVFLAFTAGEVYHRANLGFHRTNAWATGSRWSN